MIYLEVSFPRDSLNYQVNFFLFFLFVRGSQGVVSPVPMVLVAMVANKAYIKAVKV